MFHINISRDENWTEDKAKRLDLHLAKLVTHEPFWSGEEFDVQRTDHTCITGDDSASDEDSAEAVQLLNVVHDILRNK